MRCEFRISRHVCRAELVMVSGRFGTVHWRCPACERREAGICRTCPRRVSGVVGRSLYCGPCRAKAHARYSLKSYYAEHDKNKTKHRLRARRAHKEYRNKVPAMSHHDRGVLGGKKRMANMTPIERSNFGRKGGRKGGATCKAVRTPEQWSAMAKKGNAIRWGKQPAG